MGIVSFQVLIGEVMGLEMLPMHTSSSVALLRKMRGKHNYCFAVRITRGVQVFVNMINNPLEPFVILVW